MQRQSQERVCAANLRVLLCIGGVADPKKLALDLPRKDAGASFASIGVSRGVPGVAAEY
jgi:hypothetical protein